MSNGKPSSPYPMNPVYPTLKQFGTVYAASLPAACSQGCSRHPDTSTRIVSACMSSPRSTSPHWHRYIQEHDIRSVTFVRCVRDDSEIVRRGICQILQSHTDIEVISQAADGADAVRQVREHRPDVVLLDITMPVMNGFEAARLIKHEFPSTLILVVSQSDSAPFAREANAAGASGYVMKSNASSELIPMMRKTVSEHLRT